MNKLKLLFLLVVVFSLGLFILPAEAEASCYQCKWNRWQCKVGVGCGEECIFAVRAANPPEAESLCRDKSCNGVNGIYAAVFAYDECNSSCTDNCVKGLNDDGTPNTGCTLPNRNPLLSANCGACVAGKMSGQVAFVKSQGNSNCSDLEAVSHLCNGGVGQDNASLCSGFKQNECASACGGSGSGYGWYCKDNDTIWAEHQDGSQDFFCDCSPTNADCRGTTCRAMTAAPPHARDAECYTPTSTTTPTSSVPTAAPTPTTRTIAYRYSENPFAKNDSEIAWEPYTEEPITFDYTFERIVPQGQQFTLYVQFKADDGTLSNVLSKNIKYLGPDPAIDNIVCSYDPGGGGTLVTINGANFGDKGNSKVKVDSTLNAEIISWRNDFSSENTPVPSVIPTGLEPSTTPVPTSTLTPTATLAAPSCSVVLNSSTFNNGVDTILSAFARGHGKNAKRVEIYLKNSADIGRQTGDDLFPVKSANCPGDNDATCVVSEHYTFNKPPGNYLLSCAAYYNTTSTINALDQCAGSLDRVTNSPTSSWSDCGSDSRKNITVVGSMVTPTPTQGVLGASTSQSQAIGKIKEKLAKGEHTVELTLNDGRVVKGSCNIGLTSVDFALQAQCRTSQTAITAQNNVRVQIYENDPNAKPVFDKKINTNAEGAPQWVAPVLEVGKAYNLIVRSSKTISTKQEFTALDGTTILEDVMPLIGDIAPVASPDNTINSNDYSELKREWIIASDPTSARAGDLNGDNRVNSIDYSCMVQNFNKVGASFKK
ncbi:MAG: dockerin type I domain-containing protein [Candidatus Daviesbacteria bacterium]